MASFTVSDGGRLAYYIDDFTDPWKKAPTVLLLHAAMGSARRYYAWVPPLWPALPGRAARSARPRQFAGAAGRAAADPRPAGRRCRRVDRPSRRRQRAYRRQFGRRLSRPATGDEPAERVRSLMLFGSTPGLKNSQAPSWIPQIQAKGLRGFLAETIADRLPLDDVDPGLVEWFLDEAAKNDPAYIAQVRPADGELRLERRGRPHPLPDPGRRPRRRDRSARSPITSRSAASSRCRDAGL